MTFLKLTFLLVAFVSSPAMAQSFKAELRNTAVLQGLPRQDASLKNEASGPQGAAFVENEVSSLGGKSWATATSFASSTTGYLRAYSKVAERHTEGAGGTSYANAWMNDSIFVNRPGHEGEYGYITLGAYVNGTLNTENWPGGSSGATSLTYMFSFADTYAFFSIALNASSVRSEVQIKDSFFEGRKGWSDYVTLTTKVRWGYYYNTVMDLTAFSNAGGPFGYSSAETDASRSAYWGGLVSATDEHGVAISDVLLRNNNSVDYAQSFIPSAVPEPSAVFLFLLGIMLLSGRKLGRPTGPRVLQGGAEPPKKKPARSRQVQ